jgi:vacuolar-type H+-ATPase subunit H
MISEYRVVNMTSIAEIKDAENKALQAIEKAKRESEKIIERANEKAVKEKHKIMETAQQKVKKLCKKAEVDAKKNVIKITSKSKDEISQIKKTTEESVSKAIDLIVTEVEKGE